MSEERRPAWARESAVLRLGSGVGTVEVTPEWAFAGSTGAGVRVAVVDSGVDADHPALDGCVDVAGGADVSVGDDGAISIEIGSHGDVFGHGTACAGVIHTLAPDASITSVRVLGPSLTGTAAAFHAGLSWAVEEGFDIINLSLGTTKRDWALAFHDVCDRAYFGGSFIVTAANNIARPSYPSLFASVASVACNTSTDPLRFHANPEPPTEFLARGINVEVPWINGGTTTTTGNSFAAPHIAGFAALVKSKHPDLRPFQIKSVLWAVAANVREATAIEPAGRRGTVFAGGSRGTAMALVRPATTTSAAPAVGPSVTGGVAAQPDAAAAAMPRRRSAPTGSTSPASTSPTAPASASGRSVDGVELGPVVGRWRWGPIRTGTRVTDGASVMVRDLGSAAAVDELRSMVEANRIDHPHVAPPLQVLADPPALVTSSGPRPTERADALAAALAITAAVAAAHGAGSVHGDLGPSWLGSDAQGRFVVSGFGAVPRLLAGAGTTATQLSVDAMVRLAPEQFDDHEVTPAVDVWALASWWCELLGGALPWPEIDQVGALLRQRLSSAPRPVIELIPDLAPLASVLDRCLSTEVSTRPVDAAAVHSEVLAALEGSELLDAALADPRLDPAAVSTVRVAPAEAQSAPPPVDDGPRRRRWRR